MLYFVYAIVDEREEDKPPEETSAYVGITNNPNIRLQNHLLGNDGSEAKNEWLQGLRLVGPLPIKMKILEVIDGDRKQGLAREKHWIQEYQRRGIRLMNRRLLAKPPKPKKVQAWQPRPLISPQKPTTVVVVYPQVLPSDDLFELEEEWLDFIRDSVGSSPYDVDLEVLLECFYVGAHFGFAEEKIGGLERWYVRTKENLHTYTYEELEEVS